MRRRRCLALAAAFAAGLSACAQAPPPAMLAGVTIVPRGHQELALGDGGSPSPVVIGRGDPLGFCFSVPPTRDTSQWKVKLSIRGAGRTRSRPPASEQGFQSPRARVGTTLCFETTIPEELTDKEARLCGELRDDFDGSTVAIPCCALVFHATDAPYAELRAELRAVLARRDATASARWIEEVEALGARARAAGYLLFELRLRLIVVFQLRRTGTPEALAEAERLLASAPAWLDGGAASSLAAQVAYERATLALALSALDVAWEQLRLAEERFQRVADPKLVTVAMKQSELLARVGAGAEAADRLRFALARCRDFTCDPVLALAAENTLAWLLLQNPDSPTADLAEAVRILHEAAHDGAPASDPLEAANVEINLAYGLSRLGRDPSQALREAERRIARGESKSARGRWLSSWLRVIEGEYALENGRIDEAVARCRGDGSGAEAAPLAARRLSCTGRAWSAAGRHEEAAAAFERALYLYQHAKSEQIGQSIVLGPGQRANDFYRAARLAIDRGRPTEGWSILRDLDALSAREGTHAECAEAARAADDHLQDELLAQLAVLDAPASGLLRSQRETIRRALLERLREAVRALPRCSDSNVAESDSTVEFRAFALDDEILVLRQRADGAIGVYRRTKILRASLLERLRAINSAIEERTPLAFEAWAELVEPLARALVPERRDLDEVTTFALHGALQDVPLAALPLAAPRRAGSTWLADATVVTYRPAGAMARVSARPEVAAAPLFIVNPSGDLRSGSSLSRFYRRTFSEAQLLEGQAATVAAFRERFRSATALHVDAHARYDPAFPELTEILLADGPLTASRFGTVIPPLRWANLSACQSGSWPITADSGRFGLAGLLARRGAAWVVGTRADVPDQVAAGFNRAFYEALAAGSTVPASYGAALRQLRATLPVTSWAALLLLESEPAASGGQSAVVRTPLEWGRSSGGESPHPDGEAREP